MAITKLTNGVNFNGDHYRRVIDAREEKGLPTYIDFVENILKNGEIPNHPLLGKKFDYTDEDGETTRYVMECVCKHYYDGGFYLIATPRMEGTKSHGHFFIDNINSTNPFIVDSIREFKEKVRWIE